MTERIMVGIAILGAVGCGIVHNWLAMIWAINSALLCCVIITKER